MTLLLVDEETGRRKQEKWSTARTALKSSLALAMMLCGKSREDGKEVVGGGRTGMRGMSTQVSGRMKGRKWGRLGQTYTPKQSHLMANQMVFWWRLNRIDSATSDECIELAVVVDVADAPGSVQLHHSLPSSETRVEPTYILYLYALSFVVIPKLRTWPCLVRVVSCFKRAVPIPLVLINSSFYSELIYFEKIQAVPESEWF